ncbi:MAG: NAD(P)H-hydrate dehydratase [Bdellovibrionota bacterium]
MRLATVAEAKRIDSRSQAEFGLTAEILMEAAGSLAAREIVQSYFSEIKRGPVLVVCGPGHNGGDGLVVARHLKSSGVDVHVTMLGPTEKRAKLTALQLKRALDSGVAEIEPQVLSPFLDRAALVVDAIFGIGLDRDVEGAFASAIEALNSVRTPVVSLDTPSGLDCDRGVVLAHAVRADFTITFGVAKRGFFVSEGPKHAGRVRILPIGFPVDVVKREAASHKLIDGRIARRLLPKHVSGSNKSAHGRAGLVGGSRGMSGALLLAAHGANRVGAGYVVAVSHEDPRELVIDSPEILTLKTDDPKLFDKGRFTALGVGPGLGITEKTEAFISDLAERKFASVVLDADALTVLAKSDVRPLRSWILTPHAGELARLTGMKAAAIEADRFESAQGAARKFGCIVLLKGFRTVVSDGVRTAVVGSGNAALAKAGSGDVLTGMITGLLAQGMKPFAAACLGAYVHGRLADMWVKSGRDLISLEPSDLTEALPILIRRIREGGDA